MRLNKYLEKLHLNERKQLDAALLLSVCLNLLMHIFVANGVINRELTAETLYSSNFIHHVQIQAFLTYFFYGILAVLTAFVLIGIVSKFKQVSIFRFPIYLLLWLFISHVFSWFIIGVTCYGGVCDTFEVLYMPMMFVPIILIVIIVLTAIASKFFKGSAVLKEIAYYLMWHLLLFWPIQIFQFLT
jgi:hypothetical protein